ncbi:immunity to superinfection [Serratia phage 92A1]|nr:immunity to superinfection [Serratia phage 92A1]
MISFCIYFLPTIIAILGLRRNTLPIFMFNLLLGWTGIIWVITFFWALLGSRR